jgi:hypothetical protein
LLAQILFFFVWGDYHFIFLKCHFSSVWKCKCSRKSCCGPFWLCFSLSLNVFKIFCFCFEQFYHDLVFVSFFCFGLQVLNVFISLGYMPTKRIVGNMVDLCHFLKKTVKLFSNGPFYLQYIRASVYPHSCQYLLPSFFLRQLFQWCFVIVYLLWMSQKTD